MGADIRRVEQLPRPDMSEIYQRLAEIREQVAAACEHAAKQPADITILAATKGRSVAEVTEAVAAGITDIGENYVQELLAKKQHLDGAGHTEVTWHAIGHLQRNKVKYVVPFCRLIHSLDSLRLAQEISRRAGQVGCTQPVLIEVNVSGEDTKFGTNVDQVAELATQVVDLDNVELQGLMTMPPYSDNPEDSRPQFQKLRALAEQLVDQGLPAEAMRHLSMGMSGDYGVAVEEGATIVRVGTALFGPRSA